MDLDNDDDLHRSLLTDELGYLRAESSSAKQNQQAILGWSLAGIGVFDAGAIALAQSATTPHGLGALGMHVAVAVLLIAVPFLSACAFGVWLGEVARMERAGVFIRAREQAINRNSRIVVSSAHAMTSLPLVWESLIFDRFSPASYQKNRPGSLGSCVLFAGLFAGSLLVGIFIATRSPALISQGRWIPVIVVWAVLASAAFIGLFLPLLVRLLRNSRGIADYVTATPEVMHADIVLPCLNEAFALQWVADRLPNSVRAIVVDNGSKDSSAVLAHILQLEVVRVPKKFGVGAVSNAGIAFGTGDVVCVMDCDGTIDPGALAPLVKEVSEGRADFAVALRVFEKGSVDPLHKWLVACRNAMLRRRFSDWTLRDVGSARVFRRSALPHSILDSLDARNGWSLDLTLAAIATLGADRVVELQVPYLRRIGSSKITGTLRGMLATATSSRRVMRKYPKGKLHM